MEVTFRSDSSVAWTGFLAIACCDLTVTTTAPATTTPSTSTPTPITTTTTSPITTTTDTTTTATCNCGQANRVTRIVGGVETEANEYPWQVGLVSPGESAPYCGGSIITRSHVLTAAHCVVNINTGNVKDPDSIQVLVGAHDTTDSNVDRRDISTIRTHPEYKNEEGKYDAAVLFLSSALTFTSSVAPV